MSGFVVGLGMPDRADAEYMFSMIDHRGPFVSGMIEQKKSILAQNYLKADIPFYEAGIPVPLMDPEDGNRRICYDGQMGNSCTLARKYNISEGPLQDERLLLNLYQKYGTDMLDYLDDAIFAFVISDGEDLFAARDLLGIKTLFYGWKDDTLYLASELKSVAAITNEFYEFPPGHYMDHNGTFSRFAGLPRVSPPVIQKDVEEIAQDVREIIKRSVRSRVNFAVPTAGLLSGGMDSSVINYLGSELYKERFGKNARLKTFAIGVGESEDIYNARIMAEFIDSDHHELIVELGHILDALREVIYCLESFDPSLVRSSVSNYLISKHAQSEGIEVLLSGEGGDEVFCGYTYLKKSPSEELFHKQMECLCYLHNNASLRLDRMNQSNSIKVVAPLISGELLDYSMRLPSEYKQKPEGDSKIEKWIFRKAYESILPRAITRRPKQEFSQGSGSSAILPEYFENTIGDDELTEGIAKYPFIRSKEELYYFRIFSEHFGSEHAVDTVGQWITL